mgnify:CR=1 FL=1
MPLTYHIDTARGLVQTTASGVLTDHDVLDLKARLASDPGWSPGMRELADISGIDALEVTADGVRQMVQEDASTPDLGAYRLAIVAPANDVFGMARMYQMLTDRVVPNIGVFRSVNEALAWIESPETFRAPSRS